MMIFKTLYLISIISINLLCVFCKKSKYNSSEDVLKNFKFNSQKFDSHFNKDIKKKYIKDGEYAYEKFLNINNHIKKDFSLSNCLSKCDDAQKHYLKVINSEKYFYNLTLENEVRELYNLEKISKESSLNKCYSRCRTIYLLKNNDKISKENSNIEKLYNNLINSNSTLNEIDEDDKKKFEDFFKSYNINKNFTEIYNTIELIRNIKKNGLEKNIDNNKITEDAKGNNNMTKYDHNTLSKRSNEDMNCFKYKLSGINKDSSWNIDIRFQYSDIHTNYLYNDHNDIKDDRALNGCSIPWQAGLYDISLLTETQFIFHSACMAHDMCYNCGNTSDHRDCDNIFTSNCDNICNSFNKLGLLNDLDDCLSDSQIVYYAVKIVGDSHFKRDRENIKKTKSKTSHANCVCNNFDKYILSYQPFYINSIGYLKSNEFSSYQDTSILEFIESMNNQYEKEYILKQKIFNLERDDFKCGKNLGLCPEGYCCSQYGYCGQSSSYCGDGCQPSYGKCGIINTGETTTDDRCGGYNGKSCHTGFCCSKYGYCGTSDEHCKISNGCDGNFGMCKN